jgi:hypothetical protein
VPGQASALADGRRRSAVRPKCKLEVTVRPRGRSAERAQVLDLSTDGCALSSSSGFIKGALVWVKLGGVESWEADVAWVGGDRAGLKFRRPLHPAVLQRLIG